MVFNKPEVIKYLKDLVYNDLSNHYKGDPQSIISASSSEFNLLPEEVELRKKLLIELNKTSTNIRLPVPSGITSKNLDFEQLKIVSELSNNTAIKIANCLRSGRNILALKELRTETGLGLRDAKNIIDCYSKHYQVGPIPDRIKEKAAQQFLSDYQKGKTY